MNISDVRLIIKPQSPIGDEYSSRPSFEMHHNKQLQKIIAEKHIHGHVSVFDLAINYSTSTKKIKEYIADYECYVIDCDSEHNEKVLNLSNICSNSEVSARTGVSVCAVSEMITKGNIK
jgi:hypothetical protein